MIRKPVQWWCSSSRGSLVGHLCSGFTRDGGWSGSPSAGAHGFPVVGLADLFTAVVIPLIVLYFGLVENESLEFTSADGSLKSRALTFATLGGVAGAAGALCIIFSIKYHGDPMFVAPLVFAGAPIVNAIVSVIWKWKPYYADPSLRNGWLLFAAGILLAAVGAGLVLYSKGALDSAVRDLEKTAKTKAAAAAVAQALGLTHQPTVRPVPFACGFAQSL